MIVATSHLKRWKKLGVSIVMGIPNSWIVCFMKNMERPSINIQVVPARGGAEVALG